MTAFIVNTSPVPARVLCCLGQCEGHEPGDVEHCLVEHEPAAAARESLVTWPEAKPSDCPREHRPTTRREAFVTAASAVGPRPEAMSVRTWLDMVLEAAHWIVGEEL